MDKTKHSWTKLNPFRHDSEQGESFGHVFFASTKGVKKKVQLVIKYAQNSHRKNVSNQKPVKSGYLGTTLRDSINHDFDEL